MTVDIPSEKTNYWRMLAQAHTAQETALPWLAIQASWLSGFKRGAVMLLHAQSSSFKVVSRWPAADTGSELIKIAAEKSVKEGKGVIQEGVVNGEKYVALAYPLIVKDKTIGVAVCEILQSQDSIEQASSKQQSKKITSSKAELALHHAMRQMQWGKVWLEFSLYRELYDDNLATGKQSGMALDAFVKVLDSSNAKGAMQSVVSLLAAQFSCSRVSLGLPTKVGISVKAISNSFKLSERQNIVCVIADAMDEAADQQLTIITGSAVNKASAPVIKSQQTLIEKAQVDTLLSVPVFHHEHLSGVLTFEWEKDAPFQAQHMALAEAVAQIIIPLIAFKIKSEASLLQIAKVRTTTYCQTFLDAGQNRRRLSWSVTLVALLLMFLVDGSYRVTADAKLEGSVQRSIVAGIDGYILSQHYRAGDKVEKGDVLVRLDPKDLVLENLRWSAQKQQYLAEATAALAMHDRAATNVARAQMAQADAQIKLISEQLSRTTLVSPYKGVVVTGDLSQSVGASVRRGDLLFEVAPLNSYRVAIYVDERDIGQIKPKQKGVFISPARPDHPVVIEVTRITPISDAKDGKTVFRVEAKAVQSIDWMQPGVEGVAKLSIGDRNLVWIWTHRFTNWLRLTLWTWLP